jgi:hypothetical protein
MQFRSLFPCAFLDDPGPQRLSIVGGSSGTLMDVIDAARTRNVMAPFRREVRNAELTHCNASSLFDCIC